MSTVPTEKPLVGKKVPIQILYFDLEASQRLEDLLRTLTPSKGPINKSTLLKSMVPFLKKEMESTKAGKFLTALHEQCKHVTPDLPKTKNGFVTDKAGRDEIQQMLTASSLSGCSKPNLSKLLRALILLATEEGPFREKIQKSLKPEKAGNERKLPSVELDGRILKFGDPVWIIRGGGAPEKVPQKGCRRKVKGTYQGIINNQIFCRIGENDPLATVEPFEKGGLGHWSPSVIRYRNT